MMLSFYLHSDVTWPDEGTSEGFLGRDAFQNMRFKLIPYIVEGPWVLQMTVG